MSNTKAIPFNSTPLRGWSFKQGARSSDAEWLEAGDPPTEIHRDLERHGKAPDYRQDLNELAVRWIGDETWTYRTAFRRPEESQEGLGVKAVLNFEGLDTFASVYLNDELVLASDNMFIQHRVEVALKEENELEIVFESARLKGLELVKQHPEHRFIVHQTEISRGPVRKAQYHWGWDWGPIIMTCGPTKPVALETYTCRLEGLRVVYELLDDLNEVKGKVQVECEGVEGELYVELVNNQTGKVEWSTTELQQIRSQTGRATSLYRAPFKLEDAVQLWWPRGYGPQSLYTVNAIVRSGPHILHRITQTTGFRHVELVQAPDSHGQSFYFRINHVDIFVGGSCWIPLDNDPSRHHSSESSSSYADWIRLAAEGNQTMVRVWGGGVYEPAAFYAAADALGVLVWQDFMFACANYPAHPAYLASVELEARQNVRWLRHHPSIVIWAGNNEDYQIVERYGLQYDPTDDDDKTNPEKWLETDFPARYIYEHLLPKVIESEKVGVPYHPSSPFGNGKSTVLKVDPTIGDVHQWNVWHGTMEPYQKLSEMGGRFVSEFGMEAYPHLETLEKCITRKEDRYPGSMAMDFRNKAIGHSRRLVSYVTENFRLRQDLEGFAHLTQVVQADAVGGAYKAWRRQWGTKGHRKCGGVLVWQLNDCWPTVSWAVVDYHGVPKPAYYAIKRAMQPIAVGVQRRFRDWTVKPADGELWQRDTSHIDMRRLWEDDVRFDAWVSGNGQKGVWMGRLTVKFISVKTGKQVAEPIEVGISSQTNDCIQLINDARVQSKCIKQDSREPYNPSQSDPFVIYARLHTADDQLISSDCSWPDPIKYLDFSADRGVNIAYSEDKSTAVVTAEKPVKCFVFSEVAELAGPLSDNGFDIMPGEKYEVKTTSGFPMDRLKWRYVDMKE
ncbi:glycoside hydrolase [Apiospora hydei]|uniref:Beta-mannosidase B n=1 Tax=Apiospora hydei TaxID=1337664 RepID=A0ABR1WS23_9PEZI